MNRSFLDELRSNTEQDLLERKHSLVKIAFRLIRQKGLGGLRVRDIAESANTSTQTIYTLFGGKTGLIHFLYKNWVSFLEQHIRQIIEESPPEEAIRKIAEMYFEQAMEAGELFYTAASDSEALGFVARSSAFTLLQQVVEEALATGVIQSSLSSRELVFTLWSCVHGVVVLEALNQNRETSGQRLKNTLDILLEGLRPKT